MLKEKPAGREPAGFRTPVCTQSAGGTVHFQRLLHLAQNAEHLAQSPLVDVGDEVLSLADLHLPDHRLFLCREAVDFGSGRPSLAFWLGALVRLSPIRAPAAAFAARSSGVPFFEPRGLRACT